MADISTEMLVTNLVSSRLNEMSLEVTKVIERIASDKNRSLSIKKSDYTRIIYYVENECIQLKGKISMLFYQSDDDDGFSF